MAKITFAVKVDSRIAEKAKKFCAQRGLKQSFFVERALEEKLEQEELKEDLLDFKTLHSQEKLAVNLKDYLQRKPIARWAPNER